MQQKTIARGCSSPYLQTKDVTPTRRRRRTWWVFQSASSQFSPFLHVEELVLYCQVNVATGFPLTTSRVRRNESSHKGNSRGGKSLRFVLRNDSIRNIVGIRHQAIKHSDALIARVSKNGKQGPRCARASSRRRSAQDSPRDEILDSVILRGS